MKPASSNAVTDDGLHERQATPPRGELTKEVPASVLAAAVERSNTASFAVWKALPHKANFVASPHSIRSALGLVYLASLDGEGRKRLREGLLYPDRNEDMDIRLLDSTVHTATEARFESANAVWVASQQTLRSTYQDAVSRILPAEVHSVDFAANPALAQGMINAWVSERTRGKLQEVIQGSAITEATRVVLVNAVYFFGKWSSPFARELTAPRRFRTAQGVTVKAEMMMRATCSAVFGDTYQAAYADYGGSTSIAFVVVVPKRWQGFRWDAAAFRRVWGALDDSSRAEFELPRFTLRSRRELGGALRKLDVDVHDPRLLQGLLASGEPIRVDLAIHEAFIQVDETATEAAASTAIGSAPSSAHARPSVFRVDRPFYFLLVEKRTGLILFMGQVTDPTAAD
jgi:serpin B